jgi:hypothetical protein
MKVRCWASVALALFGGLAIGCGSSGSADPDPASGEVAADEAKPPLAKAEATLADPPPVEQTFASSLDGVARWELHGSSGSLDAVVEGKDEDGKQVVALSIAYAPPPPAGGAAVAYSVDKALAYPFEVVRAAVRHDVSSAATLVPQALVSSGNRLVCGGSFGVALLGGVCTVIGCLATAVTAGAAVPADVACFGCAAVTLSAVGGSAAADCPHGDTSSSPDVPTG